MAQSRVSPEAEGDGTELWVGWTSQPRGGHSANATESTCPGKVPGQGLSFHRNMAFLLSNIKDTLLILVCALLKIDPD